MHTFLKHNRHELIERCKVKVAQRPKRAATAKQLENGVPMFLDQLTRTLEAEQANEADQSMQISGPAGGDVRALSEMGVSATAHGKQLLKLGYTVDQVVHDYGDLCQAITDLAFERDAPFAVAEFRTLNRCLDNAIADAVTEFSAQRDTKLAELQAFETIERSGLLAHELRSSSLAKYSRVVPAHIHWSSAPWSSPPQVSQLCQKARATYAYALHHVFRHLVAAPA